MDKTEFADISILPRTLGLAAEGLDQRERRELLVARVGRRLVGIFASEAGSVAECRTITPLPRAPRAVLGVVSVRGSMLTVLDPLALLDERRTNEEPGFRFVVTLRGDEQLALAVERVEQIVEIPLEEIEPLHTSASAGCVRGLLQTDAGLVAVLNSAELFRAAMHGTERRRKRG